MSRPDPTEEPAALDDSIQQAYDAQRSFGNKAFRSACYAPFVSLYFNTFGEVLACCKNWTYILGNVAEQRLPEIWGGRKIKALRETLADYRFEAGCEFCQWQIASGNYAGAFTAMYEEFPVQAPEPEWPAVIEFAGSNTCNFECVMCSGEFSSLIRTHREGLRPLAKVYSQQFFDDLRPFLPHLRIAKFLGGEPFLAQECFRIWDMMIEDGLATPCHVTTNGSQYNARVERILQAFPVSLSISLDGATKETVEAIRVNCDYDQLMRNIQRFREYTSRRGTYMGFSHCLMRQNWFEFGELLLFAEALGCPVFVNTVVSPSHCSLYTLPPDELDRIVDQMEQQGSRLTGKLPINQGTWDAEICNLRSNAQGRRGEQISKLQQAVLEATQDAQGSEYHIKTSDRLAEQGRLEEALQEVLKTPETNPFYYHAVALSADLRRRMGDPEGAERDLDRAVALSRRRPEAFIGRARLRFDQGRPEEGIQHSAHARQLIEAGHPLEADWCRIHSLLCGSLGRLPEATATLDRLLELQPANPAARVHRGRVFLIAGLREQAVKEVEAALALDSKDLDATMLKEQLGR